MSQLITVLWIMVILLLSLLPGNNFNAPNAFEIPYQDKIAHLLFYLIFVILHQITELLRLKEKLHLRSYLKIIIIAIVIGILCEIGQYHLTNSRNAELGDIIANATGMIIGISAFKLYLNKVKIF